MADEKQNEYGEKVSISLDKLPTTQLSKGGPFFKDTILAVIIGAELMQNSKEKEDKFKSKYHMGYVRLKLSGNDKGSIVEFEQDLSGLYFYTDKITFGKNSTFGQFCQNYSNMFKDYSDDLKIFLSTIVGKKVTVRSSEETTPDQKTKYVRHNIVGFTL